MNILTRGLGFIQKLITQGFGYSIEIITPDGVVTTTKGLGGGFTYDLRKSISDALIRTKAMKVNHNFRITVNVHFSEKPSIEVYAELERITTENKHIKINVTIF